MKPITGLLLLFLACLFSCERDDFSDPIPEPIDLEGEYEVFQIFKIQVPDLPENESSFEGTLGDQPIHAGRFSEDSLAFILPFIAEGSQLLRLPINGEEKQWRIEVSHPTLDIDYEEFFNDYFDKVEALILKLKEKENGKDWSDNFESWVNQYHENYNSLSANEKRTVLGAMHQFIFRQIFQTDPLPIANFDSEQAISRYIGALNFHQRSYKLDQLEILLSLPDQPLYQTLALGVGVGLWYRNGLNEYLAPQIFEFPILRELSFYKIDPLTKEEEPVDKLVLESGEASSFALYGNYQVVNEKDLIEAVFEGTGPLASFFGRAETYRSQTNRVILDFLSRFSLNLPSMGVTFTHKLPAQAPSIETKLPPDLSIEPRTLALTEDEFRLRIFEESEGIVLFMMESITGTEHDFAMEVVIKKEEEQLYIRSVDVLLKASCPLIFRFTIDDFQPALDMAFGSPPYSLNWIQGSGDPDLSGMPPGNYEVEVIDASGCERKLSFTIPEFGEVADNEGNNYRTVKIGGQWWMAENLRSSKLADGTPLPLLNTAAEWRAAQEPGFSWYNNEEDLDQPLGKLYNDHVACCEICPEGWRLPTFVDWRHLKEHLEPFPAGKLKAERGWINASLDETNASGFSGHAAGGRKLDGTFFGEGTVSYFLTVTADKKADAFFPALKDLKDGFGFVHNHSIRGFPMINTTAYSIRCIKKQE